MVKWLYHYSFISSSLPLAIIILGDFERCLCNGHYIHCHKNNKLTAYLLHLFLLLHASKWMEQPALRWKEKKKKVGRERKDLNIQNN